MTEEMDAYSTRFRTLSFGTIEDLDSTADDNLGSAVERKGRRCTYNTLAIDIEKNDLNSLGSAIDWPWAE